MMQTSRYILAIAAAAGCVGLLYFLSLILHIPFTVTAVSIAAAIFFLFRWLRKQPFEEEERISKFAFGILLVGLVVLTNKSYYIAERNGTWDAWAIWNLHAKYLACPDHWKNMFLNTRFAHPDYPLSLSSTIAFFSRLAGGFNELISFGVHFLITLSIPTLIFLVLRKRSIIFSGLAMILIATNEFYITQGTYQLADTMLALFFLCAIISINHHEEDRRMLVLSAFFLGCCMWTKNEGVVLAFIFTLFHLPQFFTKGRLKYTAIGFALPLLIWLLFKLLYAPGNDLLDAQSRSTLVLLSDKSRYKLIYDYLKNNLQYFKDLQWGVSIYALLCVWRRQYPDKQIVMIFVCLLAYMMIYVVTPYALDWHLHTSQSRLMHQLMPALMYLLALKFSGNATSQFQARFVSVGQRLR
jgi:hypothetical protein